MNYSQLTTAIHAYTESNESAFVANDDLIIELAERNIYRSVDLNVARKYSSALAVTPSNSIVALPPDTVVVRSVQLLTDGANPEFLLQKDPSFMDDYSSAEGVPRYYAHQDDGTLRLGPTPDNAATYTLVVAYTYRPAPISSTNTTTWLGDNAPDVLLYSCLLEAARFLKEEPDIFQMYEKQYGQAIQGLLLEENARNRTDSYRIGEIQMPVGGN